MAEPRYCINCKHNFIPLAVPKHRRCTKAEGPSNGDAALCGSMRRSTGACGPEAKLWEAAKVWEKATNG